MVLLSAGPASNASAQLNLRGFDTLEDVAKEAIARCVTSGAIPARGAGSIAYGGGGSGTGQAAMLAIPQPSTPPMSRPLNGSVACPGGSATTQEVLDARAEQLLIGLDGIAVV